MFNNLITENLNFDELYEKYYLLADTDWKKGSLYIRVSTTDQVEYSPISQLKIGLKYALEHQIYIPKEFIFHDDGISGRKTDKRLGFMNLISTAKSKPKPFEVILVYSFSRFARNREDSIVYKSMLRKKCKIDVISITQPLSDGKESIILESVYEAMDEYYSLDLAENSRRGKQEKVTRGEWLGNPPYGYVYDKATKRLIVDEEKALIVKQIYEHYINGLSIRSIAHKLTEQGLRSTRGGYFSDRVLKRILHNPAYIGKVRYCEGGFQRDYYKDDIQLYNGIQQPIIDINTFNKAQEINKKKYEMRFKYQKPQPKHEHWLRGLLKCGDCGKNLVKIKIYNRKYAFFQCSSYVKGNCFRSHHIKEPDVVSLILEQLKKDFTEKLDINIAKGEKDIQISSVDIIKATIKKCEDKLKRVKSAYENGIDSVEEYKENKERLTKELNKLNTELQEEMNNHPQTTLKETVYNRCQGAYEILSDEQAPDEVKYTISHTLFDKIVYDKDNEELIIYYK